MQLIATLKNKHVVVALLVAPLLAVAAWYAVGFFVAGEEMTPQPAAQGVSYPLIERSGCRYAGGRCVLANGDLELGVMIEGSTLTIIPSVAVDQVLAGLLVLTESVPMAAVWDEGAAHWSIDLPAIPESTDRLRLVISRNDSQFFGEASLAFLDTER